MTILLIDASGHTREMEIPNWRPRIYIPIPVPLSIYRDDVPLHTIDYPIAVFDYSAEPSYPPVYRQKIDRPKVGEGERP